MQQKSLRDVEEGQCDKKSKTTKITELKVNGESITKQDSFADALNTYFNETYLVLTWLVTYLIATPPLNITSVHVIQALNLVKFCHWMSIEYFQ